MNALENVMLIAVASLLIVGISFFMKTTANHAGDAIGDVTGITANQIVPDSESMITTSPTN